MNEPALDPPVDCDTEGHVPANGAALRTYCIDCGAILSREPDDIDE